MKRWVNDEGKIKIKKGVRGEELKGRETDLRIMEGKMVEGLEAKGYG